MKDRSVLPIWFLQIRNIAYELSVGFGVALGILIYWLKDKMKVDQYELAVTIIIPLFLTSVILSCSKAIDMVSKLKQANGNTK